MPRASGREASSMYGVRSWWVVLLPLLPSAVACGSASHGDAGDGDADVDADSDADRNCTDLDRDGYGIGDDCTGDDCDDADPDLTADCGSEANCAAGVHVTGCPCD